MPPAFSQAGKKLCSTALVLGRKGETGWGEREQIDTQRETISHYKMSCQGTFGKYCYWGAHKRKQILSVTSEEKGVSMKEVLQKGISVQEWQSVWANQKTVAQPRCQSLSPFRARQSNSILVLSWHRSFAFNLWITPVSVIRTQDHYLWS